MAISKTSSFILLACLVGGCATKTVYVRDPLPLPTPQVYPTISAEALECLPQEAYTDLVVRDSMRKEYARELYEIISAHNAE